MWLGALRLLPVTEVWALKAGICGLRVASRTLLFKSGEHEDRMDCGSGVQQSSLAFALQVEVYYFTETT